jgi:hypothetical protein
MPLVSTLFPLGTLVATPGALEALGRAGQCAFSIVARHQQGDWGDLKHADQAANILALVTGERIFSVFETDLGTTLWIITEADRSATTILLPDEY